MSGGGRALIAHAVHLASPTGRRPRLAGADLALATGRVTVLIGPNGAGKSSLLACLAGLEGPTDGTVQLDGRALAALDRRAVARAVALVGPPGAADVDLTVGEVVALGRLAHRRGPWVASDPAGPAAVRSALETTDMAPLAHVRLSALSSGERQRARLAAALAQGSAFLLLDEPTAALDPGHARQVLDLLRALAAAGRGVAMALHDLAAVGQYADAVALLAEGRVVASGTAEEVLRPDVLEPVYRTALAVVPHPHSGRPLVVADYAGR